MKRIFSMPQILTGIFVFFLISTAQAGIPVWTFSTPSPASVTISDGEKKTVQYTITNQSSKPKDLFLDPRTTPSGLSASQCKLAKKGSTCTLILTVNGSAIPQKGIHSGPALCNRKNPQQCYRPGKENELHITFIPTPVTTYTVSASGDANVTPSPAIQQVNYNGMATITLAVASGYTASIAPGNTCGGSLSGNTFTSGPITADCSVNFSSSLEQFTVSASGDANVTPSPTSQQVSYNDVATITLTVTSGYTASIAPGNTCGGSLSGNTFTSGPITAPCSVSFSSSLEQFTVSASGDANVTPSPTNQQVNYNDVATITLTVTSGYTASIAPGNTCGGSLSGNTFTSGPITAPCSVSFSSNPAINYTRIYVETNNSLVAYSPDNGTHWGAMLSPQGGWNWDHYTSAIAVTADGTMYKTTGVQGNSTVGNGTATLIYSSDGENWFQVANFPTNNDWVQSLFAVGNTLYVGTGNGYVYYTSTHGITWLPSSPAQIPDSTPVKAIVVDMNGNYYAGTEGGAIYYSNNSGQSWNALMNQPAGGGSISGLAVDTAGTLYALTSNTTTQPQYNSTPLTTGTWQSMSALNTNAMSIAASGNVVYVGTSSTSVMYTSDKGQTWAGNSVLSDNSGVASLFVNQASSLSPLFVESYGTIPITNSTGTGSIVVTNLSSATATNVHANSSQLPPNVTSNSCASIVPGESCSLTFTANGAQAFAPTAFDIIDNNGNIISRSALVSSITPDAGTNYFYVYSMNGNQANVLDNNDIGLAIIWSSDGTSGQADATSIYGIDETSTSSIPSPTSNFCSSQQNCNGATSGSCNSGNILTYYNSCAPNKPINLSYYAAGLCYQSINGGASIGSWYLPSTCELNGSIYLNLTTNNFSSCASGPTGIFSLHSLGALGGVLQGLIGGTHWSSTESSTLPQYVAWLQFFQPGGGGNPFLNGKHIPSNVRCVQILT
ncbi:hypothetical protein [Legionella sainthelensi]|uniref:NHL repeat protein n=1 Tax=Legionella sainthelensi TaxID=28087 RepID=A0A2H5FMK6_9GAMM|nr:hypothetical protein [Legionella sainthelensi]AUH72763.1 hypothetical protein CAB17_12425 [Legionella sainthelensi]